MQVDLTVNGETCALDVEPRMSLLDCLRERLLLTGAHAGCEHGVCGACTVLLDGAPVRSCLMFAVQADGYDIVTIEGLAAGPGELSPIQDAFCETHAMQCGYCTPAMVLTAHALRRVRKLSMPFPPIFAAAPATRKSSRRSRSPPTACAV
jgi:carbon-monoxide dehydrogenase small subunit